MPNKLNFHEAQVGGIGEATNLDLMPNRFSTELLAYESKDQPELDSCTKWFVELNSVELGPV